MINDFLKNYSSKYTKMNYGSDLRAFLKFVTKDWLNVTDQDVINYRDYLNDNEYSPATINRRIATLKSFYNWAIASKILSQDVTKFVKLPSISRVRPTQAFSDIEVRNILNQANNDKHALMLSFLFNLGLRRSELVNIKKSDVSTTNSGTTIRIKGKGGKYRILPLNSKLKKELENHLEKFNNNSKYVFSFGIKNLNPTTVTRVVKQYAKKAGIDKRVGAHSCRATVISHLLEKGESPRNVAIFAGHSNINTTIANYDKLRDGISNSSAFKVAF